MQGGEDMKKRNDKTQIGPDESNRLEKPRTRAPHPVSEINKTCLRVKEVHSPYAVPLWGKFQSEKYELQMEAAYQEKR